MDDQGIPHTVTQREENNRVGSRRDRQIHELRAENKVLRAQLEELADFVDTMASELSALRRHVQFHSAHQPVPGCSGCCPTAAERETDKAIRLEAAETRRDVA
ncbi:hypothetical protein [Nonomuraea sp. NPDC050786]|uniref:hypothetical protein n=1 Tax=Nonomuraea sp. NPDC050786 TaxID=3154840 RepID=UPI0033FD8F8B